MNVITKYGGLEGDYEELKRLAKETHIGSDLTGADSLHHRQADCCRGEGEVTQLGATGLFDNCAPTTEMPVTGAATSAVSEIHAPAFANECL